MTAQLEPPSASRNGEGEMTIQLDLFAEAVCLSVPRVRRPDRNAERQRAMAFRALRNWRGQDAAPTAAELAYGDVLLRNIYSDRLIELAREGKVERLEKRECRLERRLAYTWRPK